MTFFQNGISEFESYHPSRAVGLWDPRVRSSEGVHAARIALHTRRPKVPGITLAALMRPFPIEWIEQQQHFHRIFWPDLARKL